MRESTATVKYRRAMNRMRKGSVNLHRDIMSDMKHDVGDPTMSPPFWDLQLQDAEKELNSDI